MKPESLPTHTAILYLAQNLSMLNMKKAPDKSTSQHSTSIQQQANQHQIQQGENCHTHAMPNGLWCLKCHIMICRACAGAEEHRSHSVKTQNEARDTIRGDIANELLSMQKTLVDVQHLVLKQREFLLKILEACTALKTQIETELINHMPTLEIAEMRESLCKAKLCLSMLEQQSPSEAYKLYSTLHLEKQRLQSKYQEMYLQCKLDDLIRHYGALFDFDLIKQALAGLQSGDQAITSISMNGVGHQNQVLLLANYCISQLYSRHVLTNKHSQLLLSNTNGHYQSQTTSQMMATSPHEVKTFAEIAGSPKGANNNNNNSTNINNNYLTDGMANHPSSGGVRHSSISYMSSDLNGIAMMQHLQHSSQQQMSSGAATLVQSPQSSSTIICNPTVHVYPIYYFNIEINGSSCGRILIEVRNDVAPKMAKNFGALSTGELGFGYKGCQIFQCWENESIITGDFELNNGRGGRSVFEEGFFMPDDTKILAIRGSVGMRRSQKRHDNMGLVGSQFRIILREMRGFTGIFAFVVEGLELVEKISQAGDSAGKPQSSVIVVSCGKLQ